MKKIIILALIMLSTATVAMTAMSDDRPVTLTQLPKKAQAFIKQHFPNSKISYAKQDTGVFDGEYDVVFTDGKKIEFLRNGEWKDIECKESEVPSAIVMQAIKNYVKTHHANQKIVEIDRDSRNYELKLSDGTEMKFSLKGKFLGYDY